MSGFQNMFQFWSKKEAGSGEEAAAPSQGANAPGTSDEASVQEVMHSINASCRAKGGKYATYSCKTVSWDDVKRGNVGGQLSCWGANITDTYLKSRSGKQLFTVRSDNWNEKLGVIDTNEVALVHGNECQGNAALKPITLKTFLKNSKQYGGYAGLSTSDLSDDVLDKKCSIRFQTTFLPVSSKTDRGTIEFSTEAYNYNTRSDDDPRNLVLLCTTQGIALQQDGRGTKKLYHHAVDATGTIRRYWLEAERSSHKVGGAQVETNEEKADAIARGKATSSVIGTKAMGTRFNVLMTIQIPLKQKEQERYRSLAAPCGAPAFGGVGGGSSLFAKCSFSNNLLDEAQCFSKKSKAKKCSALKLAGPRKRKASTRAEKPRRSGTANAARVSRGTEVGTWTGLSLKSPIRNPGEHITITVVNYFTIAGGVPSEADVCAAIDDMEQLYASCNATGRLAEDTFDFMKGELAVKDVVDIAAKLETQPPPAFEPPSVAVTNFDQFPSS